MLIRDIDPDLATQLPADFYNIILPEIDYCDQSEAPPTKATQTHALLFHFRHTPPSHNHEHIYKGLFVYSPPLHSLHLGAFSGTGALVANKTVCQEIGTPQRPSPWVRIYIPMVRSAGVNPATGEHRVSIGAAIQFRANVGDPAELVPGSPGLVERALDADIALRSGGLTKTGNLPFMELTNVPEGDRGRIFFTRTTVTVP
jgi:hypothetical protein